MTQDLILMLDHLDTYPWYKQWVDGFLEGCHLFGVRVSARTHSPGQIPPGVPVVLSRYTLYPWLEKLPTGSAVLVEHTSANPMMTTAMETGWYSHPAVGLIASVNPGHVPWIQRYAGDTPVTWIGFPYPSQTRTLLLSRAKNEARNRRLIVFGQSIRETNDPCLAVRVAIELIRRKYEVVFATPQMTRNTYPVALWKEWGIDVVVCSQHEFYQLLWDAEALVSTTLNGALTVSAYEGYLAGARPVVPATRGQGAGILALPPFNEPYHPTYMPGHPTALLEAITHAPVPAQVDEDYFNPTYAILRLMKALHTKGTDDVPDQQDL